MTGSMVLSKVMALYSKIRRNRSDRSKFEMQWSDQFNFFRDHSQCGCRLINVIEVLCHWESSFCMFILVFVVILVIYFHVYCCIVVVDGTYFPLFDAVDRGSVWHHTCGQHAVKLAQWSCFDVL